MASFRQLQPAQADEALSKTEGMGGSSKLNAVEPHASITEAFTSIANGRKPRDIEGLLQWSFSGQVPTGRRLHLIEGSIPKKN